MGLLDEEAEERPEPNITGSFDCQTCNLYAKSAHYDARAQTLRWWCPEGHESLIEEFGL